MVLKHFEGHKRLFLDLQREVTADVLEVLIEEVFAEVRQTEAPHFSTVAIFVIVKQQPNLL